jgi:hypothetical protein
MCTICGVRPIKYGAIYTCGRTCMAVRMRDVVETRKCKLEGCENTFLVGGRGNHSKQQRFCSRSCAAKLINTTRIRNGKTAVERSIERALARRPCKICGKPLDKGVMYCSRACYVQAKDKVPFDKMSWDRKRETIIKEQDGHCAMCDLSTWGDRPISLQIDHGDGDNENDARDNLKALCPNCHSLTPTWRGRNLTYQVTELELEAAIRATPNIRSALLSLGMAGKGGNYHRARRVASRIVEDADLKRT